MSRFALATVCATAVALGAAALAPATPTFDGVTLVPADSASVIDIESATLDANATRDLVFDIDNQFGGGDALGVDFAAMTYQRSTIVEGTGTQSRGIALADFNSDGRLDVAAARVSDVRVVDHPADTMFGVALILPVPAVRGVVAADFDADGDPDIAVVTEDSTSSIRVFPNANGTFDSKVFSVHSGGTKDVAIAAAPLTADALPDLVVGGSDGVHLLVNVPGAGGVYTFPAKVAVTGTAVTTIATGDIDLDGDTDVVALAGGQVLRLLNDGGGGLTAAPALATGSQTTGLELADLDGDGVLDAAVGEHSGAGRPRHFSVLPGDGAGGFGAPVAVAPSQANLVKRALALEAGDFDGDGGVDLAFGGSGSLATNAGIHIARGLAAPTLGATAVDLGAIELGGTAATRSLLVRNDGSAPLALTGIAVGGRDRGDVLASGCESGTLMPAGDCALALRLRPRATGTREALIHVFTSVSDVPLTATLTGSGLAPQAPAAPPAEEAPATGQTPVGGAPATGSPSGAAATDLPYFVTIRGAQRRTAVLRSGLRVRVGCFAACRVAVRLLSGDRVLGKRTIVQTKSIADVLVRLTDAGKRVVGNAVPLRLGVSITGPEGREVDTVTLR